jgi:hypothetical protein
VAGDPALWIFEGLSVEDFRDRAKELCEAEHKHSCVSSDDHDCNDWTTYPEAERQVARRRLLARLEAEKAK